ncbi:MAG: DUF58 domain-containing protein [Deltaproteobacteria bacterium]|nr:DUF58 domain-containing protein [Deltaproteobacteria bacterium]
MLPSLFTSQFLARLETLRIRTRRRFLGSRPGGHLSLRRGAGLEFADYRHYTPGDDPRYIDWKLYSRTDLSAHLPSGKIDTPAALARHLQTIHRPGKAIWLSDFLFPAEICQAGLNLLRAANFDLAIIQVLGHADLDPPLAPAGARLVDSESNESALVRFDAQAKKEYVRRLEQHNRELRSFCHQRGVHYAQFTTGQDLQQFVLRELPALGMLT